MQDIKRPSQTSKSNKKIIPVIDGDFAEEDIYNSNKSDKHNVNDVVGMDIVNKKYISDNKKNIKHIDNRYNEDDEYEIDNDDSDEDDEDYNSYTKDYNQIKIHKKKTLDIQKESDFDTSYNFDKNKIRDKGLKNRYSIEDKYFNVNNKNRNIEDKLEAFERRVSNYSSLSDINKKEKKIVFARKQIKILIGTSIMSVVVIIGYFAVTYIFNTATITVTPRTENIQITNTSNIELDLNDKNIKVLELIKTEDATLPKSELQKVISKSKGKVTIFNNYNKSPQKLIKNTRLQSEGGKVFRITDSVTVPGMDGISPGKVIVDVVADDVGESFNISPSKFTIPGFKDSDRHKGFYAISESNMFGGADGNKYIVAKEDVENTNTVKESNLKTALFNDISLSFGQDEFILATNTALYKFENNLTEYEFNKDDKYKVTGTIYILALEKSYIAKLLSQKNIKDFADEDVNILNLKDLSIDYNKEFANNYQVLKNKEKVKIDISGNTDIVYTINPDLVKNLLMGASSSKESFTEILGKMTNVNTAVAKVFPPWSSKYPNNREKIKIIDSYTQ